MVLWATAASLVPAMTRGNEAARTAHITFNCMNILLFAWQVRPRPVPPAHVLYCMRLSMGICTKGVNASRTCVR